MANAAQHKGTVIAAYRRHTLVETEDNALLKCQQRKSIGNVVCGDIVNWQQEDAYSGVITSIENRTTVLERPDINGNLRIIASNIDQVCIVTSHKPELNEGLVDRYLVAAEHAGIKPLIILNKTDLLDEKNLTALRDRLEQYRKIGYPVIYTSAKKENGLDSLLEQLQDKNNIFIGQSGVGKSSLINALLEDIDARTAEISESTGKGKHTTTTAYLYPLQNSSGHIIDSPGVREFGLVKLSDEDVTDGFVEFREYVGSCKFRNCAHQDEPGCALKQAVEENRISARRWKSYHRIIESNKET